MGESQAIPSREEIDVYGCLDGRSAAKHFLGKTLDEAEALFRENSVYYQEDLMWMGPVAFRFYVRAAIRYVESEYATSDSGLVSCVASIFRFRLEHEPAELRSIASSLADFCSYVIEHFGRFDVDPAIYGDLHGDYSALVSAFRHLTSIG